MYVASFTGLTASSSGVAIASLATLMGLALIGGLAVACFTKVFGVAFLGEPRTIAATRRTIPVSR